ncbi:hypothetical protein KY339_04540 [Candidatus Woesearchaeota archaeon]|nr:hypothetical protein [Candidatus Woesearchaeota archaeon]
MGFFERFFKKKEIEKKEIKLSGLSSWFNEEIDPEIGVLKAEIKQKFDRIDEMRISIREKLDSLENAKLKNEKISVKERQVMEGNRVTYIKLVSTFVNSIRFPEEMDYNEVKETANTFKKNLENFSKSSARSYFVLQEFFANESASIASDIKELDNTFKQIRDVLEKYSKYVKLMSSINEINNMCKTRLNTLQEIEKERENHKKTNELILETELKIKKLRASDDYKKMESMQSRKEHLLEEIRKQEDVVFQLFSPLTRPMKKFARIALENEGLLNNYIDAPAKALFGDTDYRIIAALESMKKSLENNSLELKEKEKEKALNIISGITGEGLRQIVEKKKQLNDSLDEVNKRLRLNDVSNEIERMEYKQSHLSGNLDHISERVEKLEKSSKNFDIENAKLGIQNNIAEILSCEVEIN